MLDVQAFSVAMCVYAGDDPLHFQTAVDSVICQTVQPREIVIVVDGPVPERLNAVIQAYERKELFHIIRLPENLGHGEARRRGIESCRCELIALMDADDVSVPVRFEKQLASFAADSELAIVGGDISEFVGTEDCIVGYRRLPVRDDEIKQYMRKRCPFNQVTVMFRKEAVQQVGGYLDWYCEEDYYLWIRMYLAGMKFANIPEVLVNVRVGREMYQRRGGLRYFTSEAKLQRYMRHNHIIGVPTYVTNVVKRFIVQVLLPNRVRGWVFQKFARSNV